MSASPHYRIYDQILTCDHPLAFAPVPDEAALPEQSIWKVNERQGAPPLGDRIHDLEDHPGGKRLQVFKRGPGQGAILYGGWHFDFDLVAQSITYQREPESGWSLDTLLERVAFPIALLTTDRPLIALHGSALLLPGGEAIAIIGDSGAGKSTTALGLVRRGATLLADDLVLIDVERLHILAGAPSLRLALPKEAIPEACASRSIPTPDRKRIFELPSGDSTGCALPLDHLFALGGTPDAPAPFAVSKPRGGRAAALVLAQCFGFSAATPADEEARFRRAMRLIRSTPLSHIAFQRGGDSLSQLDAITHALRLSAEAP